MLQNLLEKLQLKEAKNILIQGLPSSIEKQFVKIPFAKNVTPLLKSRGIDFALIFVVSENQLKGLLKDVIPAMGDEGRLWIAYPKAASKIATDLNRSCSWNCVRNSGFESVSELALDHVWTAYLFTRQEVIPGLAVRDEVEDAECNDSDTMVIESRVITPPADFMKELRRSKIASSFFEKLPVSNKSEYVSWIAGAKRQDTRSRRMEAAIGKLIAGKMTPGDK